MKTDKLIDMLSTNVEPVDSRRVSRRLAAAIVIGIAIAACLMTLALGLRSDLTRAGALSSLCLKLFFAGVVVVVASVALNKVMRPSGERKVPLFQAQRSRAPIQRLADVVSSWFVPAAMALSSLSVVGNALRLRIARL